MTLELAAVTLYAKLALCVGVQAPLPMPRITLVDRASVACGRASSTGRCYGVYRAKTRIIQVAIGGIPGTTAHELVHDLLRQAGRNDPGHTQPEWTTCLPRLAE